MDQKEQKRRDEELDRFWDIDSLIPPRKIQASRAVDTETVEIVVEAGDQASGKDASQPIPKGEPHRYYVPPHKPVEATGVRQPDEEYTPMGELIHTVRIFRQKSNYRYYEAFVRDAERLSDVRGRECIHVPFFSYVPQYSQMNRQQLEWYLWWRECFQNGAVPTTDYSYLLLYVYELIHRKDLDPASVQQQMCKLWLSYREVFHQLDTYLPEWICDFSLLHRLPPPEQLSAKELAVAMSHCALKEFYVSPRGGVALVRGLLIFGSNYDYHKSKFYVPELKKLFDVTVLGALNAVFERTGGKTGTLFQLGTPESSRLVRDSYAGALCADSVKRKIAVEYTSLSCTHSLRLLITDIVKYTENRLRAYIGVRARLSIYALPKSIRDILDDYLKPLQPRSRTANAQKAEETPAYERLYDQPTNTFSPENAAKIEQSSWSTTERLIEAFEEEQPIEEKTEPQTATAPQAPTQVPDTQVAPVNDTSTGDTPVSASPFAPYFAFLEAAVQADGNEQKRIASQMSTMIDAIADRINELATEAMGDILLEERDGVYCVLEDYLEWAIELMIEGKEDEDGAK